MFLGLTRLIMAALVRVEVHGHWPQRRPCLIAPRHLSLIDPFVLVRSMRARDLQTIYWAGATVWLFRWAPARWFSRASQILPVDPVSEPRSSLALAAACLDRGHGLVWFPEGMRSPDGQLLPVRSGVGHILRAQPVPVVPVAITGTREVLPPGSWLPRPGRRVSITIGEPIEPEALGDDAQTIAARIEEALAAVAGESAGHGSAAQR